MKTLLALAALLPAAALAQSKTPAPKAPPAADATPTAKAPPPAASKEAAPAPAAPAPGSSTTLEARPALGRILLAPKLGLFEPTSRLSGAFYLGLEAGYLTPALGDRLAVVLEVDWVRPRAAGTLTDPRIVAGDGYYSFGNAEVGVLLSGVYRHEDLVPGLTPYGGLGPGLYFHRTATQSFGSRYIETEGKLGFQLQAGADYRLGPGAAFLEFRYHFTSVDFVATGNANVGGFLALGAGYRLRL